MSTYFQRLAQRTGLLPADSRQRVAADTPWDSALGLQVVEQVHEVGQAAPPMGNAGVQSQETPTVSNVHTSARRTAEDMSIGSGALPVPSQPSSVMASEQTIIANAGPNMPKQPALYHISTDGKPAVTRAPEQAPPTPIGQRSVSMP